MSRNIEIKARLRDRPAVEAAVGTLATQGPFLLAQEDVFFHVPRGRLKLRTEGRSSGELIHYRRADQAGPKLSDYTRVPTADAGGLLSALECALGVRGRVSKLRTLYLVGRNRVHLDRVAALGDFLELEVVLGKDESCESGLEEATELLERLGILDTDLESRAYIDLLA